MQRLAELEKAQKAAANDEEALRAALLDLDSQLAKLGPPLAAGQAALAQSEADPRGLQVAAAGLKSQDWSQV